MTGAASLGMIELTTREGSLLWLLPGAIYAIERDPHEDFTMVKTASEPIGVMESPRAIAEQVAALDPWGGGPALDVQEPVAGARVSCPDCGVIREDDRALLVHMTMQHGAGEVSYDDE